MTEQPAGPSSLPSDESLSLETSQSVVRTVEWSALCYQTGMLIWSVSADPFTPIGKVILALLIPGHVALLPAYARGRGPFSRGGAWVPAAVAVMFGINGLAAFACRPGTYGNPWFYLVNYSAGTFGLLACYPWPRRWRRRLHLGLEVLAFLGYAGFLVVLVALNNGSVTWTQLRSLTANLLWPLLGYVLGKALLQVSVVATARQLDLQRRNFTEFFHFLHSNVKAGIAAVGATLPATEFRAWERLRDLDAAVSDYRVGLVLARERVPVAELLSERIRAFVGTIRILEIPRVGALTVSRPVGIIIGRALGDLLTNTVVHGASAVRIDLYYDDQSVTMRIDDDGPGFDDALLDEESTSLHRLRQAARDLRGDLVKADATPRGTSMTLSIPLTGRSTES